MDWWFVVAERDCIATISCPLADDEVTVIIMELLEPLVGQQGNEVDDQIIDPLKGF